MQCAAAAPGRHAAPLCRAGTTLRPAQQPQRAWQPTTRRRHEVRVGAAAGKGDNGGAAVADREPPSPAAAAAAAAASAASAAGGDGSSGSGMTGVLLIKCQDSKGVVASVAQVCATAAQLPPPPTTSGSVMLSWGQNATEERLLVAEQSLGCQTVLRWLLQTKRSRAAIQGLPL
jgi:hypothetical protein